MLPILLAGALLLASPITCDVKHVLDGSASPQSVNYLAAESQNGEFWWMSPNSPLKAAYDYYKKCNEKGNCLPPVAPGAPAPQPFRPQESINLNLKNNPFLNGNVQGNANFNENAGGSIDISKNPFLSGVVTTGNGAAIPEEKDGFLGVQPQQPFGGDKKKPGFATTHPLEQKPQKPGFAVNHPLDQHIICRGAGFVCVDKELCIDGIVNKNGEGILQTRSDVQYCNKQREACCQLETFPHALNEVTAGKSSVPGSVAKFGAGSGFSAGTIQVLPQDAPSEIKPRISVTGENGHQSTSSSTAKSVRDVSSSGFQSTVDYSDVQFANDVRFGSTFQGPAYLPPLGSSPPPKYSTPDFSTPKPSISTYQPSVPPRTYVPVTTPVPTRSPSTPRPVVSTYQPSVPSRTYVPVTTPVPTRPTTNREYLPPRVTIPSSSNTINNQYVPSRPSVTPSGSTPRPYQPSVTPQKPYQPNITPQQTYQPSSSTPRPYQPSITPQQTYQPSVTPQQPYQPSGSTPRPYQPSITPQQPYQPSGSTPRPYQPSITPQQPYQPSGSTPRPYQPSITPQQPYQPTGSTPRPYQPSITPQQPYQPSGSTPKPYQPSITPQQPYQPSSPRPFQPTTSREYLPPRQSSPQPSSPRPNPFIPETPYQPSPDQPSTNYEYPTTKRPYQPQPTPSRPTQRPYQPSPSTNGYSYQPSQSTNGYSYPSPSPSIPTQRPYQRPTPTRPPYQPSPSEIQPRPTPTPYNPSTNGYTYPSPSPSFPTQPTYRPRPTPSKPTPRPYQPSPSEPQPGPTYRPSTSGYSYPTPTPAFTTPRNPFIPQETQPTQRPYQPSPSTSNQSTLRPYQPPTQRPYQPTTPRPVFSSTTLRPNPDGYNYPTPTPKFEYPDNQTPSSSNTVNNQYIPPPGPTKPPNSGSTIFTDAVPDSARNPETFQRPPQPPGGENTAPPTSCAAALKCVQEIYCTADGFVSPVPVVLTKEQELARVPTTVCQDQEAGIIGKCCRDPNYKDPWPSANLVNGVDDGQYKEDDSIGQYKQDLQRIVRSHTGGPRQDYSSFKNIDTPVAQEPLTCGERHLNTNPPGPGPLDVNFAEIPWQAMVLRDSNRSLLCGGAIIRRDAVLTTAHCVEGLETSDILIKGGEWKLGIDEEPLPFQIVKVVAIVRHPQYVRGSLVNDLAILVLEEKLRPAKNIGTICLPPPNQIPTENCIVTGWGKRILQLHAKGAIMHSINVGIMDNKQCQETLASRFQEALPNYSPNTLCGFSEKDQCKVDYGSALACSSGNNQYTLSGIFAWDTGCKQEGQVGGYIAPDVEWIESSLAKPLKELKRLDREYRSQ